jgi:predicted transcriptional regulator
MMGANLEFDCSFITMSRSVSLTIDDELFRDTDEAARALHLPREAFIVQAIRKYANEISRRRLRNQLRKESALTAAGSMKVLREFEAID